jgi:hypothetical protein
MRKTIDATLLIERANHFLAHSEDSQRGERLGVAGLLETLLLDASVNVYAGFSYLESAGMTRGEDGYAIDFADDSRRQYNVHHKLRD